MLRRASRGAHFLFPKAANYYLTAPKSVSILSAPFSHGQPHKGVSLGPSSLLSSGLSSSLHKLHWRTTEIEVECGTLNPGPPPLLNASSAVKNSELVSYGVRNIAAQVEGCMKQGHFPLLLGGDHTVALGSISGLLSVRPATRVLWIDAHADINTPATSQSQNCHGMPVAFLTKLVNPATLGPHWEWLNSIPPLPLQHIVYIGLRDVDEGEVRVLKKLGVLCFTMHDIDRVGIGEVMKKALKHLLNGGVKVGGSTSTSTSPPHPLHLSFDIDACDPSVAPSTGTAVPGGLTYREAHYICEAAAASGALCSMDMVEVNPELGSPEEVARGATARAAVALIGSAMGKTVL